MVELVEEEELKQGQDQDQDQDQGLDLELEQVQRDQIHSTQKKMNLIEIASEYPGESESFLHVSFAILRVITQNNLTSYCHFFILVKAQLKPIVNFDVF